MTPEEFKIEPYPWTLLDPRSGVADSLEVWRRDDHSDVQCLDELVFAEVHDCCMLGIKHMKGQDPKQAQEMFTAALKALPEPLGRWNAAGWALLALGHAAVAQEDWPLARQVLTDAMWSPGVFGNPWAHRLKGQVHLALGERARAADDLVRAYKAAGQDVLEGTPPGCLTLVEQTLKPNATPEPQA